MVHTAWKSARAVSQPRQAVPHHQQQQQQQQPPPAVRLGAGVASSALSRHSARARGLYGAAHALLSLTHTHVGRPHGLLTSLCRYQFAVNATHELGCPCLYLQLPLHLCSPGTCCCQQQLPQRRRPTLLRINRRLCSHPKKTSFGPGHEECFVVRHAEDVLLFLK